jgi:hypothetical protein
MRYGFGLDLTAKAIGARPDPLIYQLNPCDVEETLPVEYRKAVAIDAVRQTVVAAIRSKDIGGAALIMGPPGTGKTFQLYGLLRHQRLHHAKDLIETGDVIHHQLTSGRKWKAEPLSAWVDRRLRDIIDMDRLVIISESSDIRRARYDREKLDAWCQDDRILAVDHIGCVKPSERVLEAVYEIATQRRKDGRTTIWTTNLNPDELRQTFGGAIASRLLGDAVVEIDGKDRRLA